MDLTAGLTLGERAVLMLELDHDQHGPGSDHATRFLEHLTDAPCWLVIEAAVLADVTPGVSQHTRAAIALVREAAIERHGQEEHRLAREFFANYAG